MADPDEGVAADGTIRTGAQRNRVSAAFEPVLAYAVAFADGSGASLDVYGSVATGAVRPARPGVLWLRCATEVGSVVPRGR